MPRVKRGVTARARHKKVLKKEEANYSSVACMIKSKREFKFKSKINLTHGIKKTLDWFLNQTF